MMATACAKDCPKSGDMKSLVDSHESYIRRLGHNVLRALSGRAQAITERDALMLVA